MRDWSEELETPGNESCDGGVCELVYWQERDDETDYQQLMTRRLLIEFVGGEPGEQLRDQFA